VVRAEVPKLKLDDVFERKDYGYDIINTLVTDIDPDI
jgi:hypothetical protein